MLKYLRSTLLLPLLLSSLLLQPVYAQEMETPASHAYMIDLSTDTVLLNKNAEEKMHPSSMSKLMTLYVLFEDLQKNRVSLEDTFTVSEKAWRKQGSKMFVKLGSDVKIEDLIRGIIVQSGNDACIVVAEGISGSEEAFAERMNRTAERLGMQSSHFVNSTGWPDDNHLMSAKDLAMLSEHLIKDFPEYYHYFGEKEFVYNNITQGNRNRLVGTMGIDGLKTGHTEAGGYGITLSALDNSSSEKRRVVLVVNGLTSESDRHQEGKRLIQWGLSSFKLLELVKEGQQVGTAEVWVGTEPTVPLVAGDNVRVTVPEGVMKDEIQANVSYTGPLQAPIVKGKQYGVLKFSIPGHESKEIPLYAAKDVAKLSGVNKAWHNLRSLVNDQLN